MLPGHDRAERVVLLLLGPFDAHHTPVDLARRQAQPADRPAPHAEVRLPVPLLGFPDDDVTGERRGQLQPFQSLVIGRAKAPRARLHRVAVRSKPAVDETSDVIRVGVVGQGALQVDRRADHPGADVAGVDVETGREVHLIEEIPETCDPLAVELDVVHVLSGADLLLVPAAVAVHETVQYAEPVRLVVPARVGARRRNELTLGELACPLTVGKRPRMGRSRPDRPPEARDVPRREPRPAVAVALLEGGRELELHEWLAAEALDKRRAGTRVRYDPFPP